MPEPIDSYPGEFTKLPPKAETVLPLEITETSGMQKMFNQGMMVSFINRHGRYTLDVRSSFVYYDADKDFVLALENKLEGPGADEVFKKLGIRYYSKGIV